MLFSDCEHERQERTDRGQRTLKLTETDCTEEKTNFSTRISITEECSNRKIEEDRGVTTKVEDIDRHRK